MPANFRRRPTFPSPEHSRQPGAAFVVGLVLTGGAVGCGSPGGPTGPAPAPPPPLRPIEVDPASGPIGTVFTLAARGLDEGDTVAFEITFPGDGRAYPGIAITVSSDGTASTTYRATTANKPGEHTVHLTGSAGRLAEGRFTIGSGTPRPGAAPNPTVPRPAPPTTTRARTTATPGRTSTTTSSANATPTTSKASSTTAAPRPTTTTATVPTPGGSPA